MKIFAVFAFFGVAAVSAAPEKVANVGVVGANGALSYEEFSEKLAQKTNQMQKSWRAGYNSFFKGWKMSEARSLMGTKLGIVKDAPIKFVDQTDQLPKTFDSRDKWTECESLKEIRDQSACGSCWAVSSAEIATDRTCIFSKGEQKPELSQEDVMECCGWCGEGCQGGYPIRAMEFWQKDGIVTGGNYGSDLGCQPYQIPPCSHHCSEYRTPSCSKPSCIPDYSTPYYKDKHHAKSHYYVHGGESAIRQEIYKNGPVVAAFEVYEDFYNYKSGVYHYVSGEFVGGHAVKVIGWGTESGDPYWLVANSWNTTWGMDGYFKIRRGTNECGFESEVVAGLPK